MEIFSKRPLFTSCIIFLLLSVVGYFLDPIPKIILAILGALIFILDLLLFIVFKKIKDYTSLFIAVCAIATVAALLLSHFYFDVIQNSYTKFSGHEKTIDAVVISQKYDGGNICGYIVQVESVDQEQNRHKAMLECKYDAALVPGDRISALVTAQSYKDSEYGRFDQKLSMLSDGIFISYTSYDQSTSLLTDRNVFDLRISLSNINSYLSGILTKNIHGEAGKLASAILLGNRHLISDTATRDFSRAGVSHILALSGMHMAIIMGALMFILKRLNVKHKIIAVILSAAAIFYLAITGFSLSATRSVIMLLIVYLSILCSDTADSLTSLSVAGFIIVMISPGAILDAGFWMSFSATLGLLVYTSPFNKFTHNFLRTTGKYKKYLKPVVYLLNMLASGVFAMIPLIIVMCIFIKELPLWSVLSSAVLSFPSTLLILLSLLFLPISKVPYLSTLIARIISLNCNFMLYYCSKISDIEGVVLSLNYPFSTIAAIIIGIALAYSLIFKSKNLFTSLIPFVIAVALFFGTIFVYEFYNRDNVKVTYINASSISDVLVISNNREAVICDISKSSNSSFDKALDTAFEVRATEIRAVMLTRYSNSQPSSLRNIFGKQMVRELWLPYPMNTDDYNKMLPLFDVAREFDVDVKIYNDDSSLTAFSYVNIQKHTSTIERSSAPLTLISINTRGERVTYIPPAFNESDLKETIDHIFTRSQYVIFGNSGPKTKSEFSIPENNKIKVIVFADDIRAAFFNSDSVKGGSMFIAKERFEINIEK